LTKYANTAFAWQYSGYDSDLISLRGILSKYNDLPLYVVYEEETPGLKYIIRNSILHKITFVLQDVL